VDQKLAKSTESEKLQSLESKLPDNSNNRFTEKKIRSKERIENSGKRKGGSKEKPVQLRSRQRPSIERQTLINLKS
jgi:hypothetical protein